MSGPVGLDTLLRRAISRIGAGAADFADLWTTLTGDDEPRIAERLTALGMSEGDITDLIFAKRHPEGAGRALDPSVPADAPLIREWLRLRDTVVRPALARAGTPPGSGPSPRIIPRAEWGARHGRGSALPDTPLGEVVVHTSDRLNPDDTSLERDIARVQATETHHVRDRGFVGIGYSFVISPAGRIFEGRGWLREGAHTEGRNRGSHGFCFLGDGDREPATDAQWTAAHWLIGEGIRVGAVTPDPKIAPHSAYDRAKTCPGTKILVELDRLRGITG
jgi:N-acetylmuramoyl-L-alanine amidase